MFAPESGIRRHVVLCLGTAVAVHPVRINHKIKTFSTLFKSINKLKSILEMDIVISGAVCEL